MVATPKSFPKQYISDFAELLGKVDYNQLEAIFEILREVKRQKGRIFLLGMGGSASNAQHAANDFRKLCEIESYSATDNVAEFSARTNDEGLENSFKDFLKASQLVERDCIFILSVGGGDRERNISVNICEAIDYAKSVRAKVVGIVGKVGYTSQFADACVILPTSSQTLVTPYAESFQQLVWHLLVSDERLKSRPTKW